MLRETLTRFERVPMLARCLLEFVVSPWHPLNDRAGTITMRDQRTSGPKQFWPHLRGIKGIELRVPEIIRFRRTLPVREGGVLVADGVVWWPRPTLHALYERRELVDRKYSLLTTHQRIP